MLLKPQQIDTEVRGLVDRAYQRTVSLLQAHRDKRELLAATLLKEKTLERDEFETLLGLAPMALTGYGTEDLNGDWSPCGRLDTPQRFARHFVNKKVKTAGDLAHQGSAVTGISDPTVLAGGSHQMMSDGFPVLSGRAAVSGLCVRPRPVPLSSAARPEPVPSPDPCAAPAD